MSEGLYKIINEVAARRRGDRPPPLKMVERTDHGVLTSRSGTLTIEYVEPDETHPILDFIRLAQAHALIDGPQIDMAIGASTKAAFNHLTNAVHWIREGTKIHDELNAEHSSPWHNYHREAAAIYNAGLILSRVFPGVTKDGLREHASMMMGNAMQSVRDTVLPALVGTVYAVMLRDYLMGRIAKGDYGPGSSTERLARDQLCLLTQESLPVPKMVEGLRSIHSIAVRGQVGYALNSLALQLPFILFALPKPNDWQKFHVKVKGCSPIVSPTSLSAMPEAERPSAFARSVLEQAVAFAWALNSDLAGGGGLFHLSVSQSMELQAGTGKPETEWRKAMAKTTCEMVVHHLLVALSTYTFAMNILSLERAKLAKDKRHDPLTAEAMEAMATEYGFPDVDTRKLFTKAEKSDGVLGTRLSMHTLPGMGNLPTYSGGEYKWGKVLMVEPLRLIPCKQTFPCSVRGAPRSEGVLPRHMHRWCVDMAVFHAPRAGQPGGTILIDLSGSMSWEIDELEAMAASCPNAQVAVYNGTGAEGYLTIVAKGGKRIETEEFIKAKERCGGNIIDLPALMWMATQRGPRVWISDGGVTGVHESRHPQMGRDVDRFNQDHAIFHVGTIQDANAILSRRGVEHIEVLSCDSALVKRTSREILADHRDRCTWALY